MRVWRDIVPACPLPQRLTSCLRSHCPARPLRSFSSKEARRPLPPPCCAGCAAAAAACCCCWMAASAASSSAPWSSRLCSDSVRVEVAAKGWRKARDKPPTELAPTAAASPADPATRSSSCSSCSASISSRMMCITRRTMLPITSSGRGACGGQVRGRGIRKQGWATSVPPTAGDGANQQHAASMGSRGRSSA